MRLFQRGSYGNVRYFQAGTISRTDDGCRCGWKPISTCPALKRSLYRFMPELISADGRNGIAMPPLFKIDSRRGEERYLTMRRGWSATGRPTPVIFTLQRYGGGEMDAQQRSQETTLSPDHRVLKQGEVEDARMASEMRVADGQRSSAAAPVYIRACGPAG